MQIIVLLPVEIHEPAGDGSDLAISDRGVVDTRHGHNAASSRGDEHLPIQAIASSAHINEFKLMLTTITSGSTDKE